MTMTCRDAESLLHDALDAPLPPTEAAALVAHLESCGACRDLEADLALMRDATRALDRPIVPAQAWTRLSTQLEREGLVAPASASAAARPPRTTWPGYAWMALAASLLAGVGASLLWRASDRATPAIPNAVAPQPGTPGNARDPRAVEAIEIELQIAAEHYEKAITALEGLAAEDRTRIDPAVVNGTRLVEIKLEGSLPRGAVPDMNVDGTIELDRLEDALFVGIPVGIPSDTTVGVYKIVENGKEALRVPVKLGRRSVMNVEVLSGLNVGDQIITSDMAQWSSHERLRIN